MKFAKAIYCGGVGTWYVRLGSQHGIDVMFPMRSERHALISEGLINESLTRDMKIRGYRRITTPKSNKPTLKKI